MNVNIFDNKEKMKRALMFLAEQASRPGRDYKWNPSEMSFLAGNLYSNVSIGSINGIGSIPLLTGQVKNVRGITNFDGKMLSHQKPFIAETICLGWVVAKKGSHVSSVGYQYDSIPPALQFANLVLTQNGRKLIDLPLVDITNSIGDGTVSYQKDLGHFILIEDKYDLELSLEFAEGAELVLEADQELFLSTGFSGFQTSVHK